MADQAQSPPIAPPANPLRDIKARLSARIGLLVAVLGVVFLLVLVAPLHPLWGLVSATALVLAFALIPEVAEDDDELALPIVEPDATDPGILAFADALTEPCLVLDRRSSVVHRNAAATRQFPGAVTGRAVTFSLRNPELVEAIERAVLNNAPQIIELHETVPSETWNKVVIAPLRHPGREWSLDDNRLLSVTLQNLTELKRVDAMRSDFIANASHELRTPLASLLGFIETLQGPAARDTAAREKFLAIMRGQAERMARLIDDLLSLSRIEMHQHVLPTGEIDLSLLLRQIREGLQTQARDAEVEINLTVESEYAITTGDSGELYEVFENLIDNAIKYGAKGGKVDVVLSKARRVGFAHAVTVTDYGPGVAEEHVPRLTERFYRIDAESSRKKKGTGLGLAIVKHIVHRHRGLITIRSRPGEGMRVEVLLPR